MTPPARSLHLLLVEDSPEDRAEIRLLLKGSELRYTLTEVETGERAIAALKGADAPPFDAVILDFILPDMDGHEVLHALRGDDGEIPVPVIVLTGVVGHEACADILRSGAHDFIGKEWLTPTSLARSIENTLERFVIQRQLRRREERREALLAAEQAARAEAERLGRMKDEFLATLSHELRTPLNAILGWVGILQGRRGDEALQRKALDVIDRNARLQAQLIDDLLDMNRILSGKLRLELRPTSLSSAAQAAVETVRPMADGKGIQLEVDLHPGSGVVYGDPDRLQQIAWNMLSNAIKFTARGGVVGVALERDDEGFALSVSDTGMGIAAEFLPHVFERFRQADATAARRHGGLGLGLAIVRQLAELHGGAARVASAGLGKGSTFSVVLPSLEDRVLSNAALLQSGERAHRSSEPLSDDLAALTLDGIRVLVVDDQADTREFLERLLSDRGAFVTAAASAEEALAQLESAAPDVLLADIGMPDVDGYELIRRVRRRDSARGGAVPAVALTAFAREEDRERALAVGYDEHIPKPMEPSALFAAITRLTRGASAARRG